MHCFLSWLLQRNLVLLQSLKYALKGAFCSGSLVAESQLIIVALAIFWCINFSWYIFSSTIKTFLWRHKYENLQTAGCCHVYFFNCRQFLPFFFNWKENNCCLSHVVLLSRIWSVSLWVHQAVVLSYECFCRFFYAWITAIYFSSPNVSLSVNVVVKVMGTGTKANKTIMLLPATSGHAMLGWNVSNT